jgi:hypothetical protein
MSVQRQVTTTAGAGFTNISATIPVHFLRIWPNADRNVAALEYQLPDDDFATTYTTDVSMGDIIERIGHGRHGLLGHHAAFTASSQTATILAKVRFADGTSRIVNVYESENPL